MPSDLEFTGERFVPGIAGEIVYEHAHRYAFARTLVGGKRVLDAACGEGYGSALLAAAASAVIGVDIDAATIAHATAAYRGRANLDFRQGSVTALPLPDASVDVVVSFETIEHLAAVDQPRMLAEFARVLAPGGILVLSAPNRVEYSEARGVSNPFHRHEHDRAELAALIGAGFTAQRWYRQRVWLGSLLWSEEGGSGFAAYTGDARAAQAATPPAAMYFVVVAAGEPGSLPARGPALSLFSDAAESELRRAQQQAAEVLRLDALLGERDRLVGERDSALAARSGHVAHLEALVAERERIVVERDAQLVDCNSRAGQLETQLAARERLLDERDGQLAAVRREIAEARATAGGLEREGERLGHALEAQERIIAYRQSLRWWVQLPWLRARLAWQRLTGR
jgi:SAM-dependent methyltransferase